MSALSEMWRAAREGASSEGEAVRVIARQLGESEGEARRILTQIAHVKLGGSNGGARARNLAAAASESVNGGDRPQLDADAVRDFYRQQRESGRGAPQALRGTARAYGARPHDVRRLVTGVEYDLLET